MLAHDGEVDFHPAPDPACEPTPYERLTAAALAHVRAGTTALTDDVVRVPLAYYTDPRLFVRERDGLLATTPLALVATARVASPHDFVVREVLGRSVLVSRGADGVARAFLNYCRHRGARPAEGCGSTRRFTCPYHGWTYDSAGQLVGLPGAAGFEGVDRSEYGLVELPSEERHGFVWVVLTAGAPLDLDAHLGPMGDELARFDFETYAFFDERTLSASVNWKATIEAFSENYHFPYVHGGSIVGRGAVANTAVFDRFGRHSRLAFPAPWIDRATPGADHPTPLDHMSLIYWIFPNLVLGVSAIGVELIDVLPGDEPVSTALVHGWMAKDAAPDDETAAFYRDLYEQVHAAVRDEDFATLPSCGDATRFGQHDHMLIGRNEPAVQHVVRTLQAAVARQPA
jgi:phenylpropionate dioxygenase-like ring-hydroxylating dioxygenase large terminal subunit